MQKDDRESETATSPSAMENFNQPSEPTLRFLPFPAFFSLILERERESQVRYIGKFHFTPCRLDHLQIVLFMFKNYHITPFCNGLKQTFDVR